MFLLRYYQNSTLFIFLLTILVIKSVLRYALKDEKDRLAQIKSSLSDDELQKIISQTNELKKLQAAEDSPEARATIPSLTLSDLTKEVAEYPIAVTDNENDSSVTVIRHEMGSTSGIGYVNLAVDVSGLSLDDAPLLSLLSRLMMETGAGEYSDVALSRRIGTYTGGVSVSVMTTPVRPEGVDESVTTDGTKMITKLLVRGKATSANMDELFNIFKIVLTDANLDSKSKVIEMLKETKSRIESNIQGSGHSYANTRMRARYNVPGYID
jgi:Zn-dependent M16 (insulinase) family peptidase